MKRAVVKTRRITDIPVNTQSQTERSEQVFENSLSPQPSVQNGLAGALGQNGGGAWGSLGGFSGQGGGSMEQLSDSGTLFASLRWYMVSNFRQLLSQCYVEIGLIQIICDIPVDDGLRGGVKIKSQQLDEDQIKELKNYMDREDDIGTMGQGAKWNRLFGGAGILIIVDDQLPEEPLDLAAIGPDTEVTFKAVDMWELFDDRQDTEGYEVADTSGSDEFDTYDYYTTQVHKSRVMKLKGMVAPSFVRPRLRGWGFSVVETLVRSINQYLKASDLTFEVLDEFKIDVYKIKNLVNTLLGPNGQTQIQKRVQLANWQKNYQNAVVMDSEDDWDHKQLSFAGLAEAQAGIRKQVAADMRMPISKLFGASESTGMGNSDQNDMENYNSMVDSQVRTKLKFDIVRLIEIRCQQRFGFIPDDLEIEFEPLRVLSAVDEETVKEKKYARVADAKAKGELTTIEYRDACNKGKLFDVVLDTNTDAIAEAESNVQDASEVTDEASEESDTAGKKKDNPKEEKSKAEVKKNNKSGLRLWRVAA